MRVGLRKPVQTVTLDTSSGNITTSAYRQILAVLTFACSGVEIFNPSGSSIKMAQGAAASEVDLPFTIIPGGTPGIVPLEMKAGARISLKAIDTNMTSGLFVINFYD